jgi:excisionase family DNA binding protein
MARLHKEVGTAETAHRLGVGLGFVYALIWSGKLPGRKVGRRWLIPAQAIEERLKAVDRCKRSLTGVVGRQPKKRIPCAGTDIG